MFAGRLKLSLVSALIRIQACAGPYLTILDTMGTDYPTGVTGANDSSFRASVGLGFYWSTAVALSFFFASPYAKNPMIRPNFSV